MGNSSELQKYSENFEKKDALKSNQNFLNTAKKVKEAVTIATNEHEKDEKQADVLVSMENLTIQENEDKDINNFFYQKGTGHPGDIIIAKDGIRGPSPIYRYNENTKSYDCVNYTAYKDISVSTIKEMQSAYKRHEITEKDEPQVKEKIPEDLEKQLSEIYPIDLFETGDGKLFNIVWDNWMTITDKSVQIFKNKLIQYATGRIELPQGFSLKPHLDDNRVKEFEIIPAGSTVPISTALVFGK